MASPQQNNTAMVNCQVPYIIDYTQVDRNCVSSMSFDDLSFYFHDCLSQNDVQKILSAPMFWIGIYISLASLVCTLAMAADVIQGLRHKKLWFPCIFFSLNPMSLTLLAVAMKLPMDLTTVMPGVMDQLAKFTSLPFMCTVIGHFMPSLGPMSDKELLSNLTALGILVFTVVVNVCIQFSTGAIPHIFFWVQSAIALSSMLVLLVLLSFSALSVPTFKEILELKYREKRKTASNEEESERNDGEKFGIARLRQSVNKYWIMTESGGPQFVMASSVTCAASGAICFVNALNLAISWFLIWHLNLESDSTGEYSVYKQSTKLIALIQTFGVVAGTIGPAFRWVTAINVKDSRKLGINKYKNQLKTENYWVKRLVEWKESPMSLRIRARKYRKIVQGTKAQILNICIRVQIAIVVGSKLVRLLPILFVIPFYRCFKSLKDKKPLSEIPESANALDLSRYVLELEAGDYELPKRILKNMLNAVDELVRTANERQPKNLLALLEKCAGFKGVAEVDSEKVPRLLSNEPPKCWSLLVVTLTSIAIALPNIKNDMVDQLLCSVGEGLNYVRRIERTLHTKEDIVNIENATDVVWSRLELYQEWLDEDLHKMSIEGKTPEENLQRIGDIAKSRVMEFKRNTNFGGSHEDFLSWPIEVIAANLMYITSQTIMLKFQADHNKTCEDLFEQLSVVIAGVIGACLTNLPRAITIKCYSSAIEKRERTVKQAARLLGESEEILNFLQQQELPMLDPDEAAYLDDWVSKIKQGIVWPVSTSSKSEIIASSSSRSSELQLVVE